MLFLQDKESWAILQISLPDMNSYQLQIIRWLLNSIGPEIVNNQAKGFYEMRDL